jgi:hypothetical protein
MCRVPVDSEERAFIQERIDRFAEEAPEELRWQLPHVREHGALPLYVGWTETAGIRPDGTLIRWSTEDWPGAFELGDLWKTVALVKGSERFPLLRRLIPPRSQDARECESCKGSGRFPLHPDIVCQCGGVGWVE